MTMPRYDGVWLQSEPITYASSGVKSVPLAFLETAREMAAPEIAEILIEGDFSLTNGDGANTYPGEEKFKLIDRVVARDMAGSFVDLPGSAFRAVEQMEHDDHQDDPADIAASGSDTSAKVYWKLSFEVQKAHRPRDTRVELERLLAGGALKLHWGSGGATSAGTNPTVNSGTITVYARVVDGRKKEQKSRMEWFEFTVEKKETTYPIEGSLRAAILHSDDNDGDGWDDLTSITEIDSKTLELADFPVKLLQEGYKRRQLHGRADTDQFLASTYTAIPLMTPNPGQKIGAMPMVRSLHFKQDGSATTNQRLIVCAIKDRHPRLAALTAGFQSVSDYARTLAKGNAEVVAKGGGRKNVKAWDPRLVNRLPVRITGGPA